MESSLPIEFVSRSNFVLFQIASRFKRSIERSYVEKDYNYLIVRGALDRVGSVQVVPRRYQTDEVLEEVPKGQEPNQQPHTADEFPASEDRPGLA